jgi:hypothetical protein
MIIPLVLMASIAVVFHLMGITAIGAIFTGITIIYGSVVGYLSIDKLSDKFFFMNVYLLTFTLPGSVELSHQMDFHFPVNIIVWLTSYFAGGVILLVIFAWRKLERDILFFFLSFIVALSVINFFSWFNIDDSYTYVGMLTQSFNFLWKSFVNFCLNPEFIFRSDDVSVQIMVAPFILLVIFVFILIKKL